ncbi:NADPH-adrenodoxin reductase [Monosporozyma unispora]|nr:NADPH-adrenodoxin reductase [Kazachstania unispora]
MLKKTISIIGSGPSGFYTAYRLLKKSPTPIHVRLWERLPVPYGLSRYGVAPDHPEVKNCEETFEACAQEYSNDNTQNSFEFIGNVTIGGPHVKLQQLINNEDVVIFSYGCQSDRQLNIPGEMDTKGVFTSREFVNWYNGYFDYALQDKFNKFPWHQVKKVGIIGNGNVALDVTRVLISNHVNELWSRTDISTMALKHLRESQVEDIKLIGRRDFIHSKFTNKELRELWELEKYGIKGMIDEQYFDRDKFELSSMQRAMKRRIEMCDEYMKPFEERSKKNYKKVIPLDPATRHWSLDYLKTPLRINKDSEGYIKSLTLCHNVVTPENEVLPQLDQQITYELDLLITSLGYKGVPLSEFESLNIGFQRDHISNMRGRVLSRDGKIMPQLYATGWIRKGSQGVIASTMQDSFEVADLVMEDLSSNNNYGKKSIDLSIIPHTTWPQWETIDREEHRRGVKLSKPRDKFLSLEDVNHYLSQPFVNQ